jgi:hypothetical protein
MPAYGTYRLCQTVAATEKNLTMGYVLTADDETIAAAEQSDIGKR